MNHGISVDQNGSFQLGGKPFYAYGINAYTMILNKQKNPGDLSFREGMEMIKGYNIPFIRVPLMWATAEDYRKAWDRPEELFAPADALIAEAEKRQIGVIGWILNAVGFSSLMGEKAAAVGDRNSKTMEYMKRLTKETVRRYKDSPALWGWEIWNEGNLFADIMQTEHSPLYCSHFGPSPGDYNGFDSVTSEEIMTGHLEVAKSIREEDPRRMISTGNGLQRPYARSFRRASQQKTAEHTWTMDYTFDTLGEFREMNLYFTPDPLDAVCMHMETPDEAYTYPLRDTALTYDALLKEYVALAKSRGKGFYYGEFGCMGENASLVDPETVRRLFPENLKAMKAAGVQLASLWQFNGNNNILSDEGNLGFMFREISRMNDGFREAGLQDTSAVW